MLACAAVAFRHVASRIPTIEKVIGLILALSFFSADRLSILGWMIAARRGFSRLITQLLSREAARIKPANAFDFCVIDLREHRNLLSIVSNRGHKRQAFLFCTCS
jgi:hypothetical protein